MRQNVWLRTFALRAAYKTGGPPVLGTAGTSRVTCSQCQLMLSIVTAKPVLCEGVRLTRPLID